MDQIKLCQINICGFSDRTKACLENYAYENQADFIFLSETKLRFDTTVRNYSHFYKHNKSTSLQGGVGILMRDCYRGDRQSYLEHDDIDALFMVAILNRKRYLFCSAYIPPNSPKLFKKFLDMLKFAIAEAVVLKCEGFIAAGDFNARHQNWGDILDNKHGSMLLEFSQKEYVDIWSKFVGNTFQCCNGGSRIDLVISNSGMSYEQFIDEEIELFTGAPQRGHVPVWTVLQSTKRSKNFQKTIYEWDNTNWNDFELYLEKITFQCFPNIVNTTDPQTLWNVAKDLILEAKHKFVPTKIITGHSKPFWNSDLSHLSQKLRQARKQFKFRSDYRNGEVLEKAKNEFTDALNEAKRKHIENQTRCLNHSEGTQFWKEFKNTFYTQHEKNYIGVIENENQKIIHDSKKSEIFQRVIFEGQHLKNCSFDSTWKRYVEDKVSKQEFLEAEESLWYNNCISAEEILLYVKNTNCSKKSVDIDGIHPRMIKHCGHQFQMLLYKLFNAVLKTGKWIWNEGQVTLLKKPGKPNYADVGAYRPITISSYIGKLLERVLKARIVKFLEEKAVLKDSQHGFRPGFSTASYMTELLCHIEDGVKRQFHTAGIFIDLQKAFDSIWLDGLLYKIHCLGIHGSLLSLLASFLKNRTLRIKVNNTVGDPFTSKIGVPQGGVLSPILFVIYINDMLNDIPTQVGRFQYADDTSIVVTAQNHSDLSRNCQDACTAITKWLHIWRLKANCSKTDILVFKGTCDLPILSNEQILQREESKVLGILIDEKLSFDKHLSNCKNSLQQKWNLIKPFIYKGLNASTCKFILEQSIMPKTHYLAFIWDKKYRLSIYQMVKDLTRTPFNPAAEHIFAFSDILPLELKYLSQKLNSLRSFQKIKKLDIFEKYNKSLYAQTLKSELDKFAGTRNTDPKQLKTQDFTQAKIRKFVREKWKSRFINYCRANPCSGLLADENIYENILQKFQLPLDINPRVLGGICALLTGHCNLQLHLYKLNLTFSPCCICLTEDESPEHFLYRCPMYKDIRALYTPTLGNWKTVAEYIYFTGRIL